MTKDDLLRVTPNPDWDGNSWSPISFAIDSLRNLAAWYGLHDNGKQRQRCIDGAEKIVRDNELQLAVSIEWSVRQLENAYRKAA